LNVSVMSTSLGSLAERVKKGSESQGLRWLAAGLVVLIGALQIPLWMGEGSFRDVRLLRQSIEAQALENRVLHSRNEALSAEVVDLRQGLEAIEERARSELGMIREGETFFHILPGEAGSDANPDN
jgi:cell division protein FtsB